MSYILDALKKSEQERLRESSPHLNSIHGHHPPFKGSNSDKQRRIVWLIAAGLLLLILCVGIFFSWYLGYFGDSLPDSAANDPERASEQQDASPAVTTEFLNTPTNINANLSSKVTIGRNQEKIILAEPLREMIVENPMDVEEQDFFESLPFLKDLPKALQREIPELKFAGHTYSKISSQRMIIINNNILREGEKIDINTHLKEITWEGVIIDYKNYTFRVNTN